MKILICVCLFIVATLAEVNNYEQSSFTEKKHEKRGLRGVGYGYGDHLYGSLGGYGLSSAISSPFISSGSFLPSLTHSALASSHPGLAVSHLGLAASHSGLAAAHLATNVHTTVTRKVAVPVLQPYAVPVERHVPYAVKVPVAVPVDRPYPVHVPKPYPVTVEKHIPVPVDRPYPVVVPQPIEVPVPKPVGIPYPEPFAVAVPKPYPVPVSQPIAVPISKPIIHSKPSNSHASYEYEPHYGSSYHH